jgi:peptidoglycan/LPS O-acetylase OafA/YrhL
MTGYLRFLLASLVVSYHLGYLVSGQGLGIPSVVIFYVLSGSVVASLLGKPFSGLPLHRFYLERLLRIFPTYYYFLGLSFAFVIITGFGHPVFTFLNIMGNLLVVPLNYVNFPHWVVLTGKSFPLIPTAWSLGAELQAYLVLGLALRSGPIARMGLGFLSLFIFGLAGTRMLNPDLWGYRLLPGIFFMFLAGAYLTTPKTDGGFFALLERLFPVFAWLAVSLISLRCYWTGKQEILPVALGFLIGLPVVALALRTNAKLPFNHLLGDLSYGIFLAHIPVLWFLEWGWPEVAKSGMRFFPVLAISLALALIAVLWIERPIWRFRKLLSRPAIP